MELDDLKQVWQQSAVHDAKGISRQELADKLQSLKRSRTSIKKAFLLECAVAGLMYMLFLTLAWVLKAAMYGFIYKMIAVITIMSIPVFFRLYKSIRWMDEIDYSSAIRQNIERFLAHFENYA